MDFYGRRDHAATERDRSWKSMDRIGGQTVGCIRSMAHCEAYYGNQSNGEEMPIEEDRRVEDCKGRQHSDKNPSMQELDDIGSHTHVLGNNWRGGEGGVLDFLGSGDLVGR